MVDKAVDSVWKKQTTTEKCYVTEGPPRDSQNSLARFRARALTALITFFTSIFLYFCSIPVHFKQKLHNVSRQHAQATPKELPLPTLSLRDTEILSSVLKGLGEVEEKVNALQSKPSKMPHEKEELLNTAVYPVDALEAELIAKKKALHEALMKQDELFAYIDNEQYTKYQKKKFCW